MLKDNLLSIQREISNGNNLGEKITLVGATKTVPYDIINQAVQLGLTHVAENKVQEFREKSPFIVGADQQFIGHLQTNKVKYLVGNVSLIQSVDSIELANEIEKCAGKKNIKQNILLEVNIGGELSKSGFDPQNIIETAKQINAEFLSLQVVGLMAMLPKSDDEEYLSSLVKKMRNFYDTLINEGLNLKYLSVGMTEDYKIAVKNGSNMIRIGSGIFGKRNYEVIK